jgi:hypothetical protein
MHKLNQNACNYGIVSIIIFKKYLHMGTYVHHRYTRANLNKLIGRIDKGGDEKNE